MNLNDLTVIDTEKIALDDLFFSNENKTALTYAYKSYNLLNKSKNPIIIFLLNIY